MACTAGTSNGAIPRISAAFADGSICVSLLSVVAGSFRALSTMPLRVACLRLTPKVPARGPRFMIACSQRGSSFTANVIQFGTKILLLILLCVLVTSNPASSTSTSIDLRVFSSQWPERCMETQSKWEYHLPTQCTIVWSISGRGCHEYFAEDFDKDESGCKRARW